MMACSSCGGKSRVPMRTSAGRQVQQTPVSNGRTATRSETARSIIGGMRWKRGS